MAATVAGELAVAADPDEAIRTAIRMWGTWFPVQAAALINEPPPTKVMRLSGVWGFGRNGRARLSDRIGALPVDPSPAQLRLAVRAFDLVTGSDGGTAVRAGRAVVLLRGVPSLYRGLVQDVAALLGMTLDRIEREARREHDLDLGLAMTAHELRGPLLGARLALDHVVRGGVTEHRRLLRQTERELAELSAKVDALLRWSVGSRSLHLAKTDLARLVQEAVRACMLEEGRIRIDLKTPQHLPVKADPIHLRSAIENVIRNALAYSPSGSKVDVHVYRTKVGRPTVAIRDRGPGIAPEECTAVFDPFTRGRAGAGRVGNGLGLFVAKRVMDAHGGDLSFRQAADGIGTVFRLRLREDGR